MVDVWALKKVKMGLIEYQDVIKIEDGKQFLYYTIITVDGKVAKRLVFNRRKILYQKGCSVSYIQKFLFKAIENQEFLAPKERVNKQAANKAAMELFDDIL